MFYQDIVQLEKTRIIDPCLDLWSYQNNHFDEPYLKFHKKSDLKVLLINGLNINCSSY